MTSEIFTIRHIGEMEIREPIGWVPKTGGENKPPIFPATPPERFTKTNTQTFERNTSVGNAPHPTKKNDNA